MRTIELYGTISDEGVLTITNRPRLQEWCRQNKGKNVVVKLERKYNKRSSPQNRYYHGVVVQEIRLGFLDVGYEMSADEVHFFLKQKFNSIQVPGVGGEVIEVPGSTTEMTTVQFMEYVERIARWAAEYLNVTIPAPNADLKMNF
ncbi:MAG: hypothetical protein ACTHMC_09725 [Pseudobacter sp.]|uniref:hypothetical protein n=1 Tax=Pseudobacter sp. TaxID=2045420 RepID=UPI003F7E962D